MRKFIGLVCFWVLLGSPALGASNDASNTGCEARHFFHGTYKDGDRVVFDEEKFTAVAYKLDAKLFKEADGNAQTGQALRFSQRVRIVDPLQKAARIKVKDLGGEVLGWVSRGDLLCKDRPLSDRTTGLYKRAVVRTETTERGQAQIRKVYHTPDQQCEGGPSGCADVSRFQWYFVYAEENGHYLISEFANLGSPTSRLYGWLPVNDGYNWDTALGLRPAEHLAGRPGPKNEKENYVCAYAKREDLIKGLNCNETLGGSRWFGLDVRPAVLREENQTYEVVFSNAQTAGQDVATPLTEGLNKLDVFFVIDGTKSMQPAIDGVKTLVNSIREKLKGKLVEGGIIRFGFRVYRDSLAGKKGDGVTNSEALKLSSSDCGTSNEQAFVREFQKVKAYDPPGDDDFSENSFSGLALASEDVAACPDHVKLVFVIGDHGYDGAKQLKRGYVQWTEQQIAERFKLGPRFPNLAPILVFIQVPSQESTSSSKIEYRKAYEAFQRQAKSILQQIYSSTQRPDEFFVTMELDAQVVERIVEQIDTYLNPEVTAQVRQQLRAGRSLVEIIDGLRANSRLNIPIRYLEFVESALCRRLGEQCKQKVFEGVNRGFMKASDDLVPEVLLSRDQLDKWVKILDKFKTFGGARGRLAREQLVNTLLHDLQTVLQVDFESNQLSLSHTLQMVAGLPYSAHSKLMQYSPVELRDQTKVPTCEIDYLAQYSTKKYDALNIILGNEGKRLPTFEEISWPQGACPNLSDKGKKVPFIEGLVRARTLSSGRDETNYSVMHKRGNEFFFWIPVRFLP